METVSGGVPEQGLRDDEAIEAIRSDDAVRDAFVDCYTLRSIVDDEIAKFPGSGTYDAVKRGEDWDRVEASLIRAILARAALERPRPALPEPTVVNPASGVEVPMRDGWVWACARIKHLEAALRGDATALSMLRVERRSMLPDNRPIADDDGDDPDLIQERP